MAATTIPSSSTDTTKYPEWDNLVDTWRDTDAEWLRNRSVSIYAVVADRTSMQTTPMKGALSALQADTTRPAQDVGSPDFYNGTAWVPVRYPNLSVATNADQSVTIRQASAASGGVQLLPSGTTNMTTAFIGSGTTGVTIDNTGIAIKIGTKSVKIATSLTDLTIDSPVNIAGGLTTSGAATVASLTVQGAATLNGAVNLAAAQTLTVPGTVSVSTLTNTGTMTSPNATIGTVQIIGNQVKANAGTAALTLAVSSAVTIDGASVTINPPTTIAGTLQVNGQGTFALPSRVTQATKDPNIQVAMIQTATGNVAPTGNPPDGTIYFTY